jgi:Asp-tRNA(Asn)/Glu-tRNA(Gln) amidotransferase C subunit
MLTQDDTKKLATLARIALSPEELEKYTQDISKVLEYMASMRFSNSSNTAELQMELFGKISPDILGRVE